MTFTMSVLNYMTSYDPESITHQNTSMIEQSFLFNYFEELQVSIDKYITQLFRHSSRFLEVFSVTSQPFCWIKKTFQQSISTVQTKLTVTKAMPLGSINTPKFIYFEDGSPLSTKMFFRTTQQNSLIYLLMSDC